MTEIGSAGGFVKGGSGTAACPLLGLSPPGLLPSLPSCSRSGGPAITLGAGGRAVVDEVPRVASKPVVVRFASVDVLMLIDVRAGGLVAIGVAVNPLEVGVAVATVPPGFS